MREKIESDISGDSRHLRISGGGSSKLTGTTTAQPYYNNASIKNPAMDFHN